MKLHKKQKAIEILVDNFSKQTRKETAKGILEEFANLEVGDCLVAWDVIAKVSEKILELAKQFGVEVK